jgi:tetratricopeptide (TPR) repeat protein
MIQSAPRYAAARRLLRDLDEEAALRENSLLAQYAGESHDRLRARVLRAVESLDPGLEATSASERRYRLHQILVRCDLSGQSHKEVAAALGISRRQFYLDRREAFLLVADALDHAPAQLRVGGPALDPLAIHLDYVQMLSEQGRFDAVWRESFRVVREMRGHPREIEVWNIVAEAARFLGNTRQSLEALDQMSRIAATSSYQELRRASALRIAIGEVALQWMQGNVNEALTRFDRAVKESGNERTMYGRDATLFAILLGYGAELCIECGHWQRAESLIRRAERIIDRSEVPYASARQQRLRARIALELNGDSGRSVQELYDALQLLQHHRQAPGIARATVQYGIALAGIDPHEAMKYIDFGLIMAKDVCGYDESAVLFANAAPFVMERSGPDEALRGIDELRRRSPLSTRADLHMSVAEADARLARGEFDVAAEAGTDVGRSLENAALFPVAAKARVIAIEALARGGKITKAHRLFRKSDEFIRAYADHRTRSRAQQFALFLHSSAQ